MVLYVLNLILIPDSFLCRHCWADSKTSLFFLLPSLILWPLLFTPFGSTLAVQVRPPNTWFSLALKKVTIKSLNRPRRVSHISKSIFKALQWSSNFWVPSREASQGGVVLSFLTVRDWVGCKLKNLVAEMWSWPCACSSHWPVWLCVAPGSWAGSSAPRCRSPPSASPAALWGHCQPLCHSPPW